MEKSEKRVKRFRCLACQSLDTIKWDRRLGRQRYKCNFCGILRPYGCVNLRFLCYLRSFLGQPKFKTLIFKIKPYLCIL